MAHSHSRKPTKGSKIRVQKITHKKTGIGKPVLNTVEMKVPAAYNKAGQLIRAAFSWLKPVVKFIRHENIIRTS